MAGVASIWGSGLARRFLRLLFLLAFSISLLNALLSYVLAERSLEQAAFQELSGIAAEKEASVLDWIDGVDRITEALVVLLLQRLEDRPGGFGAATADGDLQDAVEQIHMPFADLFSALMILDPLTGEVIAATDRTEMGRFKDALPYFRPDRAEVGLYGPYFSLSKQRPVMMSSGPLMVDGRPAAILAAELNLETLSEIVRRGTAGRRTIQSYLVNSANLFVTQPVLESDPAVLRKANFTAPIRACLDGGAEGARAEDFRAVDALVFYRWVADAQLCLVTQIDRVEALAATRSVTLQFFVTGLIALAFLILLVLVFVPELITRLKALIGATGRVRDGDFNVEITDRNRDEIGELADNFNAMTQDLKKRNDILALERKLLMAARVEALKANDAKSRFLANMSHELRTPLNSIIGFSEVVLSGAYGPLGDPKYAEYVKDIRFAGVHLLEVINDVLDLSKIEAAMVELDERVVGVESVLEATRKMVSPKAKARGQTVVVEIEEDLPDLRADERRVRQVMVNLAGNAVKFSPDGSKIVLKGMQDAAGGIRVGVIDQGRGIAPEQLETALQPFGQLENTERHIAAEGTGLGLPLSKKLMELHGGDLEIDSAVGRGTAVWVRFPPERNVDRAAWAST
ncbi:MAG: ATP-binding protein [Alphaproteobacteria bacterium]|nr:ATP-binding protein [Alphaproteobacteria bacterium]